VILIIGATNLLGTRVCERLRAEGQPVRALVRRTSDPDKVNALRSVGCELATADLKEPPQIQATNPVGKDCVKISYSHFPPQISTPEMTKLSRLSNNCRRAERLPSCRGQFI
jgi:NmrA-like family